MNKFIKIIISFFYPKYCVVCGKFGQLICDECSYEKLTYLALPYCPKCNGRLRDNQGIHSLCKRHSSLDGSISLVKFTDNFKKILWDYKYHYVYQLAAPLSKMISNRLSTFPFHYDYVIAVPSHPSKINKRGYDHIELLVNSLNKPTINVIYKTTSNKAQAKLSRQERLLNVVENFKVKNSKRIIGKSILIIDDVITTGSTIQSVAQKLKEAGVEKVYSLTIARDIRDFTPRGVK